MSLISKGLSIYRTDGLGVFSKRIILFSIVKVRRIFQKKDQENIARWKELKNKYKGERVFIVGAGPSINKTELHLLKNEYTICFNRINLLFERLNWRPEFFMVTDDLKIKEIHDEINKRILPVVKLAFFPDLHPSNVNFKKYIKSHDNVLWLNTDKPEYSLDLPNIGINKTVTNGALQIMAYLGFDEIYMIGVDMSFANRNVEKINKRDWVSKKDDDSNHFDPRYDGKGIKYRNPTLDDMLHYCDMGKEFFDKHGIKVFNATIGGNLNSYPRVNFESLFEYSEEEKEKLFMEMVFPDMMYTNFDKCIEEIPFLKNTDEFKIEMILFSVNMDMLSDFMQVAIQTHIPFGPYKGKYIFKKK